MGKQQGMKPETLSCIRKSAVEVAHPAAGGSQVKDASGGPAGGQPFKMVAKQVFKKNLGSI